MKITRVECDRCGAELDAESGLKERTRHMVSVTYWNLRKEPVQHDIDLCDQHFLELKKFIKEGNGK